MKKHYAVAVVLCGILGSRLFAEDLKECSTEKINTNDCKVTIDRAYPVTLPTIQMKKGKVTVFLANPLPFESLSLDLQSAQLVAGTDQTQGIATGLLAQAKSFLVLSAVNTKLAAAGVGKEKDLGKDFVAVQDELTKRVKALEKFGEGAVQVYSELAEVTGTIPPQAIKSGKRTGTSPVSEKTPIPWQDLSRWRSRVLCEIGGDGCPNDPKAEPADRNLLGAAGEITKDLAQASGGCPKENTVLECHITALTAREPKTADEEALLPTLQGQFNRLTAASAGIAAISKDLNTYFLNVLLLPGKLAAKEPVRLGDIEDPIPSGPVLAKLFGRQAVFTINTVNGVSVSLASVPTATQKKAVASVTVLYANPILESSAGTFFSFLPNRSFANQTLVTPGATAALGNIVIQQTATRPTVVPFAAANWRVGPEFLFPGTNRRSAVYATAAIGLNPNTTTTEFAFGPSLSWRAIMFSGLYHMGRDLKLTQGETVGMVWCNSGAAKTDPTACAGAPPAPSTQRFWKGTFAIGISIRIPSVFPASAGGSTGSSGKAGSSTAGTSGN